MTSPKVGMRSDIGEAVFTEFSDRRASGGRYPVVDNTQSADYLNGMPSARCCRAGRRRGCEPCTGEVHRSYARRLQMRTCSAVLPYASAAPALSSMNQCAGLPGYCSNDSAAHLPNPPRLFISQASNTARSFARSSSASNLSKSFEAASLFSFRIAGACCHWQARHAPDIGMLRGTTHLRDRGRRSQIPASPCFSPKIKSTSTEAPLGNCSTPTDVRV